MRNDKYTWKPGQVTFRNENGDEINPLTGEIIKKNVYKDATKGLIKQENKKKKKNG